MHKIFKLSKTTAIHTYKMSVAPSIKKPEASDPTKDQKPAAALEEDDEFEDFPVEGT